MSHELYSAEVLAELKAHAEKRGHKSVLVSGTTMFKLYTELERLMFERNALLRAARPLVSGDWDDPAALITTLAKAIKAADEGDRGQPA